MDAYTKLAEVYDLFGKDEGIQKFYRGWRSSLLEAVRTYGVDVHTLVDLACGTGNTAIPWLDQGWRVIGVDASAPMLRQARRKSKRVCWYRQDITRLNLDERADVVTCHFDALNHILDNDALQNVFTGIARILNEGGLFQFDMSTAPWFRWLAAHEKFFPMGPHYMMAYNRYDPSCATATFHQLWFLKRGSLYEKRHITVQERAYSTAAIRRMVRQAGLRMLNAAANDSLDGKTTRMLYLAGK